MTSLVSTLIFTALPAFLPGVILSVVIGYVIRRPMARWLGTSPPVGWAFVVAVGIVLSATLTPLHEAHPVAAKLTFGCDMSRIGFAPLHELREIGDTSLNVLLFVPLGVVIGYIPASTRKVWVLAGALLLPFLIETTQLLVTPLDRACQSADVVDNGTGLVLGFIVGMTAGMLIRRVRGADVLPSDSAPS